MRKLFLFAILSIISVSCMKELDELEKYTPPAWLKGKLYTQIESQDELGEFSRALKITGLDTIINTSGLFTVFAPNDAAFESFLQSEPSYGGELENVPVDELKQIVSYHIIQNSWSKRQLATLNLNGWIDPSEEDVRSRAFKKETILRSGNRSYFIDYDEEDGYYISTENTGITRTVYSLSRKFVPVFYPEYFETYGLPVSDYEYYFNRPFDGGIYFAGGRIVNEDEIPAENGYVYIIDQVVAPLPTVEEFLEKEYDGYSYSAFLDLVYEFPEFTANLDATYQQEGAGEGFDVDTLFNLSFPDLAVNIQSEITDPSGTMAMGNIQYHKAAFAPTNEAFEIFLDRYVNGSDQWRSLKNMPRSVKRIIVNSYFADQVIYGSDISAGFTNAQNDLLQIDESQFVQKEFGSNASFIGLNQAIVPRAFSSVCGPVYLRRGYFTYLTSIEETNILDALKREGQSYSFFVIPDEFSGMMKDSSVNINTKNNSISFRRYNRSTERMENLPVSELRKMILNHVGIELPSGSAEMEFIENLAGNFLVFDNNNNIVRGSAPTSYGYRGDSIIDVIPELFREDFDNGQTWEIPTWFNFSTNPINLAIFQINPEFVYLLEDAGMADKIIGDEYEFTFLNEGTSYTVFVPTPEALELYGSDTLTSGELEQFLRNHFIPNELIFTDGKAFSGTYQTSNIYSENTLSISTAPDEITLRNKDGALITTIGPEDNSSNIMTTSRVGNSNSTSEWNFTTTGVLHAIDTVLITNIIY